MHNDINHHHIMLVSHYLSHHNNIFAFKICSHRDDNNVVLLN